MRSSIATLERERALSCFAEWLATVDYKPGWSFKTVEGTTYGVPAVRFTVMVWDTFSVRKLNTTMVTTDYTLPAHLLAENAEEVERRHFIRDCVHRIEEHEADEWLRFNGEQSYNPHGEPQMLGRRVEGWEWMGPACFEIAETLQQKGSHATTTAHGRVPAIPGVPEPE